MVGGFHSLFAFLACMLSKIVWHMFGFHVVVCCGFVGYDYLFLVCCVL